jgi:hypothetical protein
MLGDNRRIIRLMIVVGVLGGCATTVESPVSIGKNTFMISVGHTALGSGLTSHAELVHQAVVEANQFCEQQNEEMQLDTVTNSGVAGFGSIDNTITFMCVAHAQPVQLRPSPNAVIELH